MRNVDRSRLLEILRTESLLRGEFTLASGRKSDVYLDCRRTTLHPEGSVLVAGMLLDWIEESGLAPDCIGGPTLGADPIVGATVALAWLRGRELPGFLVRKEAKGHGLGRQVEGSYRPGWSALVVEDTITSGGSVLKALGAVEAAGLKVAAVACVVDREEGGAGALAGYGFAPLFRMSELLA